MEQITTKKHIESYPGMIVNPTKAGSSSLQEYVSKRGSRDTPLRAIVSKVKKWGYPLIHLVLRRIFALGARRPRVCCGLRFMILWLYSEYRTIILEIIQAPTVCLWRPVSWPRLALGRLALGRLGLGHLGLGPPGLGRMGGRLAPVSTTGSLPSIYPNPEPSGIQKKDPP